MLSRNFQFLFSSTSMLWWTCGFVTCSCLVDLLTFGVRLIKICFHLFQVSARVRRFRCDKCDKKFYTGNDLRRHLTSHQESRPFSCEVHVVRLFVCETHNLAYTCIHCVMHRIKSWNATILHLTLFKTRSSVLSTFDS